MSFRQMSAAQLKEEIDAGRAPRVLDVREPWEHEQSHIPGSTLIPLGELAERYDELDPEAPLVVLCHHGVRSMYAIGLLRSLGFRDLINLRGGIDAYSAVDPSIPRY